MRLASGIGTGTSGVWGQQEEKEQEHLECEVSNWNRNIVAHFSQNKFWKAQLQPQVADLKSQPTRPGPVRKISIKKKFWPENWFVYILDVKLKSREKRLNYQKHLTKISQLRKKYCVQISHPGFDLKRNSLQFLYSLFTLSLQLIISAMCLACYIREPYSWLSKLTPWHTCCQRYALPYTSI